MKKVFLYFIIGLMTIFWFTFCIAQGSIPAKVIEVQLNQNFTITLEANKTTGYEWQFAEPIDESTVQLISSDYLVEKTELVGVGGKQVWIFKALKPGKTELAFKYVRPWEKNLPPVNKESFEIIINQ